MRFVFADFSYLRETVCTVFEGLSFEEMFNLDQALTKMCSIQSKPFRQVNHSYQMSRRVDGMIYETVSYIIEKIFRDPDEGIMITLLEHTDGGENYTPETIEWTFPLDEVLHEIIGVPMHYTPEI